MSHGLSNQPCGPCGEDTLHRFCVCTRCGNVVATPFQQRKALRQRLAVRMKSSSELRRDVKRAAGAANWERWKNAKYAPNSSKVTRATFGRGRARTRV